MSSSRNGVIGGLGLCVLLVSSLVAIPPATAGVLFEMYILGDPYSPVPEPFLSQKGYENLGQLQDDTNLAMADIGGLSDDGNSVVITPVCTNPSDPHNGVPQPLLLDDLGTSFAYTNPLICGDSGAVGEGVTNFTITITTNSQSCLVSGRPEQLEAGTYPLTRNQPSTVDFFEDYGFNPYLTGIPAFLAEKNGSAGTFTLSDVEVVGGTKWRITGYIPASRPCAPLAGPTFGVGPFVTSTGRLGYNAATGIRVSQSNAFVGFSAPSGGATWYQEGQILVPATGFYTGITGAKRIQALPLGTGTGGAGTYGGYRTDGLYVMCGATTNVGPLQAIRCRMAGITVPPSELLGSGMSAPNLGIRVSVGGDTSALTGFQYWSASGSAEAGQSVMFRNRDVSWVGYGLHSPPTTITMSDGN